MPHRTTVRRAGRTRPAGMVSRAAHRDTPAAEPVAVLYLSRFPSSTARQSGVERLDAGLAWE